MKVLFEKEIPAIKIFKLLRFLPAAPSWWALLAGQLCHGGETLLQQFTAVPLRVGGDVPAQVSITYLGARFELGDTLNSYWSPASGVKNV